MALSAAVEAVHAFASTMNVSIQNGRDGALRLQLLSAYLYKIKETANGTDALVVEIALGATAQAQGVEQIAAALVT